MFVFVVLATALLWTVFGSTPANATTAEWNGAALTHQGRQYQNVGKATGEETHSVPKDAEYYISTEEVQQSDGNSSSSRTAKQYKAHVIYFAPGTSPPSETSATYLNYDYDQETRVFSNPSTETTVTVNPDGADTGTSCVINGVGWFVCSITTWLAEGMDAVFDILADFMVVQPANLSDTSSGLYQAWDIMRNIANIAFIIVFLIIIYAQLTSVGSANYGIKKILPRLIIAAILVNASFIITAIAIDVSNILGYSLQDVFMYIRNEMFSSVNNQNEGLTSWTWAGMGSFLLSGGTAAVAAGMGLHGVLFGADSVGGAAMGLIYVLVPALVGLLLVLLTVILILAARHAIIIICVVIAPLAFVAYLLPNTEKWFEKWKDLFMTMLIFFPAFSVVFGGSQLAGAIIIENANSINTVLLGMLVQVAPLVITPFLIKFSGNLLGKIAGMANNPNKGILDRSRNWADEKKAWHRQRGISGMKHDGTPGELRKRNWLRMAARRSEERRRQLQKRTENAKGNFENNFNNRKRGQRLYDQANEIGLDKNIVENKNKERTNKQLAQGGKLYAKNIALENGKRAVELAQVRADNDVQTEINRPSSQLHITNTQLEQSKAALEKAKLVSNMTIDEYKSGKAQISADEAGVNTDALRKAVREMSQTQIETSAVARATVAAKQTQQATYASAVETNVDIQALAGGKVDPNGAQRALAEAISIISKNKKETIDNIKTIISYKNLTDNERKDLTAGISVKGIEASIDARIAATSSLFEGASPSTIGKLIKEMDFSTVVDPEERSALFGAFADGLQASKLRPAFFDFGRIANLKQGLEKRTFIDASGNEVEEVVPITGPYGDQGMNDMVMGVIKGKTLTTKAMQEMFSPYVSMVKNAIEAQDPNNLDDKTKEGLKTLKERVDTVLDPTREGYDQLGDTKDTYEEIRRLLSGLI